MTKKELEDYLWGAANILRGMIDAADFKQYIFPLLFFKRVSDVWIEKANLEMLHDVFGDAQWTNKRRMSDEKMLDLKPSFIPTEP